MQKCPIAPKEADAKSIVNRDQLIGSAIGQRLQHRRVQFGEHRRAGSQAKCERQDYYRREGGVAPHLPDGAFQIALEPGNISCKDPEGEGMFL